MFVVEGKVAILAFFSYIIIALFAVYTAIDGSTESFLYSCTLTGISALIVLFVPHSSVARRAALLGYVFGISVLLSFSGTSWRNFGWYMTGLTFFHISEYLMTAYYNAIHLSLDSFLLNHSREYKFAAVASWLEYTVETFLFPSMKQQFYISAIGVILIIFGEFLRKAAMITAKSNFTHIVQDIKAEGHVLVTHGVYRFFRHPSYVGWFWWSIGTQVILCNPLCLVAYIWASWKFFEERIYYEEITLVMFFGKQYIDYQSKVGTGIPFIKGFVNNKITKD